METSWNTAVTAEPSFDPGMLIFRGALSLVFGILALLWPGPGLFAIALLYGIYAFIDGVLAIGSAVKAGQRRKAWGWPVVEGIFGVAAGVVTFLRPGITLFALSILVGVWAVMTGATSVAAAVQYRRRTLHGRKAGRIFLGLAGLVSLGLGVSVFFNPALGAIGLLGVVAGYSLIFGTLQIALGSVLFKERKTESEQPAARAA